jgi:benzoylformate decarboxylase
MEPLLYAPLVQIAEPLVKWAVEVTRLEDCLASCAVPPR